MTGSKYKSTAFAAIHSAVKGMHRAGTVNKATMVHFDEICLAATSKVIPNAIKEIRKACNCEDSGQRQSVCDRCSHPHE